MRLQPLFHRYFHYTDVQKPYVSTRGCKPELLSIIVCYDEILLPL